MKKRNLILLCTLSLGWLSGFATDPETKKLSVAFEIGVFFPAGETGIDPRWNIRLNNQSTYYDYGYGSHYVVSAQTSMNGTYLGIRPQWLLVNNLLYVSSGLRFTNLFSQIYSGGFGNSDYFYLIYNQTETATEYLRVKEISQRTSYMGIPLELKITPVRFKLLRLYAKTGIEVGVKVGSKTKFRFFDSAMIDYDKKILERLNATPSLLYSSFYWGLGMQFGKINSVKYAFDVRLPSVILSKNNTTLCPFTNNLSGLSFSVYVPFK